MPIVLLFMMTAALLFTSCAVKIHDYQFCSPIPGGLGAVCDNFLTSNHEILDKAAWEIRQTEWIAAGNSVECTTSKSVGDIKGEIEKLCSVARCDRQIKAKIMKALTKIEALGKDRKP